MMISCSFRKTLAIAGSVLALSLAIAAPAKAASFTITVDDGGACNGTWQTTGSASSPTITCVSGTPPPAGAPTCSITASQTVASGTSVPLQLNCTVSGGGTITYSWNQGSVGGTQVSTSPSYTTPLLTTTTTYYATATANGQSTTYSTTVTVSAPPPAANNCSNYSANYLGQLNFDGTQIESYNMRGNAVAYGKIVVPNPLPASWVGKTATVSVFEYADGAFWKKIYLSKTPCDFTPTRPAFDQSTGPNLYMTFGVASSTTAVAAQPGDVWYLNVKNETLWGTSSCGAGLSCNFAVRVYPPN